MMPRLNPSALALPLLVVGLLATSSAAQAWQYGNPLRMDADGRVHLKTSMFARMMGYETLFGRTMTLAREELQATEASCSQLLENLDQNVQPPSAGGTRGLPPATAATLQRLNDGHATIALPQVANAVLAKYAEPDDHGQQGLDGANSAPACLDYFATRLPFDPSADAKQELAASVSDFCSRSARVAQCTNDLAIAHRSATGHSDPDNPHGMPPADGPAFMHGSVSGLERLDPDTTQPLPHWGIPERTWALQAQGACRTTRQRDRYFGSLHDTASDTDRVALAEKTLDHLIRRDALRWAGIDPESEYAFIGELFGPRSEAHNLRTFNPDLTYLARQIQGGTATEKRHWQLQYLQTLTWLEESPEARRVEQDISETIVLCHIHSVAVGANSTSTDAFSRFISRQTDAPR